MNTIVAQRFFCSVCLIILLGTGATTEAQKNSSKKNSAAPYSQFNRSTQEAPKESEEKIPLGLVVRELNASSNMSLVLMNGIENVLTAKSGFEGLSAEETLDHLLRAHQLLRFTTKYYTFIYPPGYAVLSTVDISTSIPKKYSKIKVNIAFGADTPLFSALALISHSTGLTLVADQVLGDSLCGELTLRDTPLPQALEALIQSARIQPQSMKLVGTQDYILLTASVHSLRKVVQTGNPSKEMKKKLKKKCSVALLFYTPQENEVSSPLGASKLHTVLSELSLQIGIPIKVDGKMKHLPVNPMVLNNVSRATALELIAHQWMLPIFTYDIQNDTIVFQHAGEE